MKAQQYAEAIYIASCNKSDIDTERVVGNVLKILKNKGHIELLPSVLRELEKIEVRKDGENEILIRVAKESDTGVYKDNIETDIKALQGSELPRKVLTDDTLVGGYEVRVKGERVDRTHKRKLLNMYNNLITN